MEPEDETMRRVVQFMLAEIMAQRSDPAATNMMRGALVSRPSRRIGR